MLQRGLAIFILSIACSAQDTRNLAGTWTFTLDGNRLTGTIVLRPSGDHFTGTWHTSQDKSESDTTVSAKLYGNTVMLTRMINKNNLQDYVLTLSPDGKHLDGYGQGWSLNHTNLKMTKTADAPASRSSAGLARPKEANLDEPGVGGGHFPVLGAVSKILSSPFAPLSAPKYLITRRI